MICESCNYVNLCIEQRGACTSYRNRDEAINRARKELEDALRYKEESVNIAQACTPTITADEDCG